MIAAAQQYDVKAMFLFSDGLRTLKPFSTWVDEHYVAVKINERPNGKDRTLYLRSDADGEATHVTDIVGSVQETTMLDRVFREPALVDERVERVMEAPFPVVQANEDIERLYAELSSGAPALLAASDDRPVSIITKADLLEFVAHQRRRAR